MTMCKCLGLLAGLLVVSGVPAAEWDQKSAAAYLDERAKTWFEFSGAYRGANETRTSCLSCHTALPYALARPALRQLAGAATPTAFEQKLLDQARRRVEHWKALDTPAWALMYDFNDDKKKESWGTEAVLDALVLAQHDRRAGRTAPSDATRQAFVHLWELQAREGKHAGSWDWLDFGYEPWEAAGARYYGAALAAIAVGTAPGYYAPTRSVTLDDNMQRLRGYLRDRQGDQNLFNRAWLLWASVRLDGILTADEQQALREQLLAQQRDDGGWCLASLGTFTRRDKTPLESESDGYATGLVLHVLQKAGLTKDDARVAKGLAWLRTHQTATGAWPGYSLNKKRDPASHAGKFMSDAATAFAVLALSGGS